MFIKTVLVSGSMSDKSPCLINLKAVEMIKKDGHQTKISFLSGGEILVDGNFNELAEKIADIGHELL